MEKQLVRERIWNYKQRHTVVVKEGKVMTPEDFYELFVESQNGKLIKATPKTNPVTTVYAWEGFEQIQALFGAAPIQEHPKSVHSYTKSTGKATHERLEVHYNRNMTSLERHFHVLACELGYEDREVKPPPKKIPVRTRWGWSC